MVDESQKRAVGDAATRASAAEDLVKAGDVQGALRVCPQALPKVKQQGQVDPSAKQVDVDAARQAVAPSAEHAAREISRIHHKLDMAARESAMLNEAVDDHDRTKDFLEVLTDSQAYMLKIDCRQAANIDASKYMAFFACCANEVTLIVKTRIMVQRNLLFAAFSLSGS